MEINAALAADLGILSQALDGGGADLADALRQLGADARRAVPSYLGLTVEVGPSGDALRLTAMEPFVDPGDVISSLLLPVSEFSVQGVGAQLVVILYAARSGAFVDLAADLSWLTGRPLTDFAIDGHVRVPVPPASGSGVRGASLINQAIGVLIGRGYTPEEADVELDTQALAAGHTRVDAANVILAGLDPGGAEPLLDG